MAELFALSQPQVNYWLRRLLAVLCVTPWTNAAPCPNATRGPSPTATPPLERTRRIIDGTERAANGQKP